MNFDFFKNITQTILGSKIVQITVSTLILLVLFLLLLLVLLGITFILKRYYTSSKRLQFLYKELITLFSLVAAALYPHPAAPDPFHGSHPAYAGDTLLAPDGDCFKSPGIDADSSTRCCSPDDIPGFRAQQFNHETGRSRGH